MSLRTLYRLIDTGQVPAYEIGRGPERPADRVGRSGKQVYRLRRTDLDAFLEGALVQPGTLGHLHASQG